MRAACARGERAFFVCPRIEDDEEEEELGAVAHGERLARGSRRSGRGRARRDAAGRAGPGDARVPAGEAQVLVGTTVIEVGIDVPEATLMVVDGAERFGLAQLHQLRGRVGRGERPGRCLLVHDEPLLDLARRRLETVARTTDGADIARADLDAARSGGPRGHAPVRHRRGLHVARPERPARVDRAHRRATRGPSSAGDPELDGARAPRARARRAALRGRPSRCARRPAE